MSDQYGGYGATTAPPFTLRLPNPVAATGKSTYAGPWSSSGTDDAAIVAAWMAAVRANGGVPERRPPAVKDAGLLVDRYSGPGTEYPTMTQADGTWQYVLAPADVLAADERIRGTSLAPSIPTGTTDGTSTGLDVWGAVGFLKQYGLWIAAGVVAVLVLPSVLATITPHRNPPRKRRRASR